MLDYLAYLWAQERMKEQFGELDPGPNLDEFIAPLRGEDKQWRRRTAHILRAAADRLEPRTAPKIVSSGLSCCDYLRLLRRLPTSTATTVTR